jgi:hypothetical protein
MVVTIRRVVIFINFVLGLILFLIKKIESGSSTLLCIYNGSVVLESICSAGKAASIKSICRAVKAASIESICRAVKAASNC